MDSLYTILIAMLPAAVSFLASLLVFSFNRSKFQRETMAEQAARKLLSHRKYTDRSFEALNDA